MTFTGLTDPKAVEIDGNPYVQFEDGKVVECQTTEEAEALAEAWRQWPYSPHPPVEQSRGEWRTGFAAGAAWLATQSTFRVSGPTPGLCIHVRRRQVCTRMLDHEGEHLMVDDTLTPEQRFLATAARFPVHTNGSQP